MIAFKPQRSHGDDGWWSGWQRRRGSCSSVHVRVLSQYVAKPGSGRVSCPGRRRGFSGRLRDGVGTTGNGLVAALALPDTNRLALDGVLSAEGADVAGVLGDFHLLHLLTQGGTVSVGSWSIFDSFWSGASRSSFMVVRGRVRGMGAMHTWYHIYR